MIRECCMGLLLGGSLAAAASGQTTGELLAKHVQASGGGKYRSLKTVRISGKLTAAGVKGEPVVMEFVPASHKLRMELTKQGIADVRAYDGHVAWAILRSEGNTGPVRLNGDGLKEIKDFSHFQGRLFDSLAGGEGVEYVGEGKLDGTPVHQLELPDTEDGEATKAFLDAKSFLERGEERFWSAHGQSVQYLTVYSDFRQVEGLTLPYRIETRFKETQGHGMTTITGGQVLAIDKIEVNVDLPESRFARPKAHAAKTP